MTFEKLRKNLKQDFSSLKKIRVALLSDSASQFLAMALRGYGYECKLNLDIYEAPYNQIDHEILNPASDLYHFNPDFILIFNSSYKLHKKFSLLTDDQKVKFSTNYASQLKEFYAVLIKQMPACKIIYANFPEINTSIFGNYANKVLFSFDYQLRQLNVELMHTSEQLGNLFINDLSNIQNKVGRDRFHDYRLYINADMAYSLDVLPELAKNTLDIINAMLGNFKKCLILDLDNTLWGGIIGDDGIENIEIGNIGIGKVYSEFQTWIKELKERGIILAICSQNNEEIAKRPFINHPEMILRLEDISVFVANWGSKAENIKYIQSILNIGFNSMVFVDDDVYQRHLVRTYLPEVCVPELPHDPANYLSYLSTLNLFEIANFSEEDKSRAKYYKEESERIQLKSAYTTEVDYLKSLEMEGGILAFNEFTLPRVTQLIQRSNQFNLRTIRYAEEQLLEIAQSKEFFSLAFSMKDKFGEYGIVSIIIVKSISSQELFIDTWIMSCRVLKRTLEGFALNWIVRVARNAGYKKLIGEYIPTNKNSLVVDHYKKMGFQEENGSWHLNVDEYQEKVCYIASLSNELNQNPAKENLATTLIKA